MRTQSRLNRIEGWARELRMYAGDLHGTSLSRQLCAVDILRREGVRIPKGARESCLVWCLGVGGLSSPKVWIRGLTIGACLTSAEAVMQAALRAER